MSEVPVNPIALPGPIDLRSKGGGDAERLQVARLAQEFEAMLLLQMVRQMRQSMLDETEAVEGLGQSTLTDTFDVELSRSLAQAGGVGFATYIVKALDARLTPAGSESAREIAGVHSHSEASAFHAGPVAATTSGGAHTTYATPSVSPSRHADGPADMLDGDPELRLPFLEATTSSFGWRTDPIRGGRRFHGGVDLGAAYGTAVPAAAGGEVVFAGERGSYGNLVIVRHAGGLETRYAHLSTLAVAAGDRVEEGAPIGRVGSTGRSTAPHLHFEVLVNGERVDPERLASRLGRGPLKSGVSADD
jgi:murein DD-endopeptidase MepM/ murein hydrolase activator NlpD